MSSDNRRSYILTISTSLLILVCLFYFFNITKGSNESYFSIGLLDSTKTSANYFNGEDSQVNPDETYSWYVFIENKFSTSKQTILKVKLINQSTNPPNTTSCIPCISPVIYSNEMYLGPDQSAYLPFEWVITQADNIQQTTSISNIQINDREISVNVQSSTNDFRFIFELWAYDSELDEYVFKWGEANEACSWAQIWFHISEES